MNRDQDTHREGDRLIMIRSIRWRMAERIGKNRV